MVFNEIIDGCDWPLQNTSLSLIENSHSENLEHAVHAVVMKCALASVNCVFNLKKARVQVFLVLLI